MTKQHRSGAVIVIGSLRAIGDGKGAVRMESVLATDVDDLWSALTAPDRLIRWVAEVHGDMRPTGKFLARFTSGWDGVGRIDVCEAPRRLLVTMMPGTAEETVIEAVLTGEGEQTRLVVEERGVRVREIGAHGAGWQAHVEDLHGHLNLTETASWKPRWVELTRTINNWRPNSIDDWLAEHVQLWFRRFESTQGHSKSIAGQSTSP